MSSNEYAEAVEAPAEEYADDAGEEYAAADGGKPTSLLPLGVLMCCRGRIEGCLVIELMPFAIVEAMTSVNHSFLSSCCYFANLNTLCT